MPDQNDNNRFVIYEDANLAQRNGAIILRKEQEEAIESARAHFMKNKKEIALGQKKFLWNAKMRFGKTLCALQLSKLMKAKSTLIVTHRPVVDESFHVAFEQVLVKNIIKDSPGDGSVYKYGSKSDDAEKYDIEKFKELKEFVKGDGQRIVFFVSMQYLRRHKMFSDKGDDAELKTAILEHTWDFVVVDEAHEGTRTSLGQRVIDYLYKSNTKMLHLSGTPFNLCEDFNSNEIYTWDYTAEQRAKAEWIKENNKKETPEPPENNPYYELPEMKIFTYDLGKIRECKGLINENSSFQFKEFFRTFTGNENVDGKKGVKGKFIHEDAVNAFLNQMCEDSETSNYPFSTDEYRMLFAHTLWVVPGVKEARALEKLIKNNDNFKDCFEVVNVAGEKEDDEEDDNALKRVKDAIGKDATQTRTITISCGRLTTGVTVEPWTAVFYMKGSENTSAATYMQTIFRVQSPYTPKIDGVQQMKTHCYVFDFAPDRSLKMIAETAKFSTIAGKNSGTGKSTEEEDKKNMSDFLDFCPVVSLDGGQMVAYDANSLFASLEKVYIDRVVRNGYNDNSLYNVDILMAKDPEALNRLREILKKSSNMDKPPKAKNEAEQHQMAKAELNKTTKKQKADAREQAINKLKKEFAKNGVDREPTEQEIIDKTNEILLERANKAAKRQERDNRIKILSAISLRIPLLIYGADVDKETDTITRDNFTSFFRDANGNDTDDWKEFMPRYISTQDFDEISNCYSETIFSEAGKRIRQLAREADEMPVNERIKRITTIFDYFHNPDKETVLTKWRVVNMHMSDCLGGYCFLNEKFDGPNMVPDGTVALVETTEPRFVDRGEVTEKVFKNKGAKILEINSKTGLYPLYVTYSLYRQLAKTYIIEGVVDKDKGITQELIDAAKGLTGEELEKELNRLLQEHVSIGNQYVIWDDILRNNIFVICNTDMAAKITRRTLRGFRDEIESDIHLHINSTKLVERAKSDKEQLIKDIKSPKFWGYETKDPEMKFTAIVGNPPYQINDGSGAADDSAIPVYNKFVDIAKTINPYFCSMIMPSKWMVGGRGLSGFRNDMYQDHRLSVLKDFEDSAVCFPNQHIDGGICYFLWDKNYNGVVSYEYESETGEIVSSKRYLNNSHSEYVIRDYRRLSLIEKVCEKKNSFKSIVSNVRPFGIRGFLFNEPERYPDSGLRFSPFDESLKIYGVKGIKGGARRIEGYVKRSFVSIGQDNIDKYKIYFTTSYSTGALTPPEIILGDPGDICTETFLVIGPFKTEEERNNCAKYIQTKFFKILLYFGKGTMHVTSSVFGYIPMVDFAKTWSDEMLYKEFKLREDEIKFIESKF